MGSISLVMPYSILISFFHPDKSENPVPDIQKIAEIGVHI